MFDNIEHGADAGGRYDVLVVALGERGIVRRIGMSFWRWWDGHDGDTAFCEVGREVFPVAIVLVAEE